MKRTIKACGKTTRIPMSLSNYMYSGAGIEQDKKMFIETINSQPMDPEKICRALNGHQASYKKYRPYRQTANQIQIIATDYMGNEDLIYITEEE